jgi:hypothetical protein
MANVSKMHNDNPMPLTIVFWSCLGINKQCGMVLEQPNLVCLDVYGLIFRNFYLHTSFIKKVMSKC